FSYRATDSQGADSSTATVTITVTGVYHSLHNTGVDDLDTPLGNDVIDGHYSMLASDPLGIYNLTAGYAGSTRTVPDGAFPFPYWLANDATGRWIAPAATGASAMAPYGYYIYRMIFNLTGYDPSRVVLQGNWATDNQGPDIRLNNHSL